MSAIAGPGQDVWTYVNLTLPSPWFLATFVQTDEEVQSHQTILLSSAKQVVKLLKQLDACVGATKVMLITPARINKSDGWKMDTLDEIWQSSDAESDTNGFLYKLSNGMCYTDFCCEDFQEAKLANFVRIANCSRRPSEIE